MKGEKNKKNKKDTTKVENELHGETNKFACSKFSLLSINK